MKKSPTISDAEFERRTAKLFAFLEAHPELTDALTMWMADRETCEAVYPEEAEVFRREMQEF